MSDNWKRTTRQTIVELHQGGESYREMAGRLSAETGQGIPHHWLFDIARGKSAPTRKLAHALGVATEQGDDRVQFSVRMTRAERDELQAAIDAVGIPRLGWLQMPVGELRAQEALQRVLRWCNAYPLAVFPEPDLARVRELLEAGGITLDSVSASTARHVLAGVAEIAREGIA